MASLTTDVFFYGLFMDHELLEAKGVRITGSYHAFVRDWALRIGERATLLPAAGQVVHGVVMNLTLVQVDQLYAEASVRMYRPAAVLAEGVTIRPAITYVLPEPPSADEHNAGYATKLRALGERLKLPPEYTASIE
jgi:hypothetical protein